MVSAQKNEDKRQTANSIILKFEFAQNCITFYIGAIRDTYHVRYPTLQEHEYIPLVKDFIALQKHFEKPMAAGTAIARQHNKKPGGKAKAKAKAAA